MNKCHSCGAPIRWAVTEYGRRIPLDPTPTDAGNIHLYDGVAYVMEMRGQAIIEHRAQGDVLYVAHFATCPHADQHRKKRDG